MKAELLFLCAFIALLFGSQTEGKVYPSSKFTQWSKSPRAFKFSIDEKTLKFGISVVEPISTGASLMTLESGDIFFRANGATYSLADGTLTVRNQMNTTGSDCFGAYQQQSFLLFSTIEICWVDIKQYTDQPGILIFSQRFVTDILSPHTGDPDSVVSSFPSLLYPGPSTSGPGLQSDVGYVHFSGEFAGSLPQHGVWAGYSTNNVWPWKDGQLSGGYDSGVLNLFRKDLQASITIVPFSEFMAASMQVVHKPQQQVQWGIMGNATFIPAGFSVSWIMVASTGVNSGVRMWGQLARLWYSRSSDQVDRDYTLSTLGYGTANGAYYYYWTDQYANYQQLVEALKETAANEKIPFHNLELDSWWYYRDNSDDKFGVPVGGVVNWTAMPEIFPSGLQGAYNATKWRMMAHNRYWAPDNVYASNPQQSVGPTNYTGKKYPFNWGIGAGLPSGKEFWDYFFERNSDWGLNVYLQDWFSITTPAMPQLTQNITFGRDWLHGMAYGAARHNMSIQYCMEFPRNILMALELPPVTQGRASNDYQPQSAVVDWDQWMIGEPGLWMSAINVWPSKDSFWTTQASMMVPHYDKIWNSWEYRGRLQSAIASMSGGPVQPSDPLGRLNRTLIMRSCNSEGLLLRPDTAASMTDSYFFTRAFVSPNSLNPKATFVTHSTVSGFTYYYLLAVNIPSKETFTPQDLPWTETGGAPQGRYITYEANASNLLRVIDDTANQLVLQPSDVLTFQYFTLIPAAGETAATWMLQGEVDKWIGASKYRFDSMIVHNDSSLSLRATGGPKEVINVAFVHTATLKRVTAAVQLSSDGIAHIHVTESGTVVVSQ